jgi:hypothetical protein
MIQRDNTESMVATHKLVQQRDIGVFWQQADDLIAQLNDHGRMATLRDNVWRQRTSFTFDTHVDHLVDFLRHLASGTPSAHTRNRSSGPSRQRRREP